MRGAGGVTPCRGGGGLVEDRGRPCGRGRLLGVLAAAGFLAFFVPGDAGAQDADWSARGSVAGSMSYGEGSQTNLTVRGRMGRRDEIFESTYRVRFDYGQATDDEGASSVNRRSWSVNTELDLFPPRRWKPVLEGGMLSSLQRNIDLRYDAGLGLKVDVYRGDRGGVELSSSVSVEREIARDASDGSERAGTVDGRIQNNVTARWDFADGRVSFTTRNWYRPVFDELSDFEFVTRNNLSFEITDRLDLTLDLDETYDARDRDGGSSRDGTLQLGVAASI